MAARTISARSHQVVKRRCGVFDERGFDHAINVLCMTLVQRNKDRLLVRAEVGHFCLEPRPLRGYWFYSGVDIIEWRVN
jgi:hypothetical protein